MAREARRNVARRRRGGEHLAQRGGVGAESTWRSAAASAGGRTRSAHETLHSCHPGPACAVALIWSARLTTRLRVVHVDLAFDDDGRVG